MNDIRTTNITKSIPIKINNQYILKHGLFDPMQNSPPSIWTSRLINRIDGFSLDTKNSVYVNTLKIKNGA